MSAHFLLTAAARTLSLKDIYQGGEEGAFATFCRLRWHQTDGEPVCPRCGAMDPYRITTRRKFKCKACGHHFSPTSGTIFASRKLGYVDTLAAICIVTNGAKGLSALQLARDIDVQHKTAWVMAHKVREAMAAETKGLTLDGTLEIDGAYVGGHIRPANIKVDRVDRRHLKNKSSKRRVVIVIRQRAGRTLTAVTNNEAEGVEIVKLRAGPGATIHADEATHWDQLEGHFDTKRINHTIAYSLDGATTNQAESFISRLRRMIDGQHHHVSPQYLHQYASHAAWLEDHRRLSNGVLAHRALKLALGHPVSRTWKGYWQRAW